MTQEEAQRRKEANPTQRASQGQSIQSQPPQLPALDGALNEKAARTSDGSQPPQSPLSAPQSPTSAAVERTMRKAHKQLSREDAAIDKDPRRSSEEVLDRTLAIAEHNDRTLLPVIGELGENSNCNSTANSRGKSPAGIRMVSQSTAGDADEAVEDAWTDGDINSHRLSTKDRGKDDPSVLRQLTASPNSLEHEKSIVNADGCLTGMDQQDPHKARTTA